MSVLEVEKTDWNSRIKVTRIDRMLSATFLKLLPKRVTPNQITGFRYITLPFVLFFFLAGIYDIGTILFILSAFSDALDGAKARTTGQITEWGIVNDPIADKLLIGGVAIIVVSKFINIGLAFLIIFMEMCLIMFNYWRHKGKVAPARWSGKVKMFFQCVGVISLLFFVLSGFAPFLLIAEFSLWTSIFFAFIALFVYNSI